MVSIASSSVATRAAPPERYSTTACACARKPGLKSRSHCSDAIGSGAAVRACATPLSSGRSSQRRPGTVTDADHGGREKYGKTASVLSLPDGGGYHWLREAYSDYINFIYSLADHIILVGHIKDKFLVDTVKTERGSEQRERSGGLVASGELDLTGKIKAITCARADAIGYIYKKTEMDGTKEISTRRITFKTKGGELLACSRIDRLNGNDICISRRNEDGSIETYWKEIFINE